MFEEEQREAELNQRAYVAANTLESIRRTREKLRQAQIDNARRQFSFRDGVPVKLFTEDQIQQAYANLEGREGLSPYQFQEPEARSYDDSKPNNFSASFHEPSAVRQAWFALLARTSPPSSASTSQRAEASTRFLPIRERRY